MYQSFIPSQKEISNFVASHNMQMQKLKQNAHRNNLLANIARNSLEPVFAKGKIVCESMKPIVCDIPGLYCDSPSQGFSLVRIIPQVPGKRRHRIEVLCPGCAKWVPSGRLSQHVCKPGKAETAHGISKPAWDFSEGCMRYPSEKPQN